MVFKYLTFAYKIVNREKRAACKRCWVQKGMELYCPTTCQTVHRYLKILLLKSDFCMIHGKKGLGAKGAELKRTQNISSFHMPNGVQILVQKVLGSKGHRIISSFHYRYSNNLLIKIDCTISTCQIVYRYLNIC